MPYVYFESEEHLDVDDLFQDCSESEKKELYELCCEEFDLPNALENKSVLPEPSHDDKTFTAYLNAMAAGRWRMSKEDEEMVMTIAKKYFFV